MWQDRLVDLALPASVPTVITALIIVNVVFNILANAAFHVSARSTSWSDVLTWQLLGNMAGLITVLAFTGLLRYVPLSIAFPVTTGMSILGVQVLAARWLFHESIDGVQWAGAMLIGVGVFLVKG